MLNPVPPLDSVASLATSAPGYLKTADLENDFPFEGRSIFSQYWSSHRGLNVTFGERLQAIREVKGLTLPELSKGSRLGVATLFRYQQMAAPGTIAYDALVRLAGALEVDVRYLTGEDQALVLLEPSQVAARESLKRFLEGVVISQRLQRGLARIQDDRAAPKSIQQWRDFWRLLQRFSGRSDPEQRIPTDARNKENRATLRVLRQDITGKKPPQNGQSKLRVVASR